MRRLFATALAGVVLMVPVAAFADSPSPDPDLGSDDPALQQRVDSDEPIADDRAVIEAGHVDLGPRFVDGTWTLLARDDTAALNGGKPVWRRPEETVFAVSDTAKTALPESDEYAFTGAKPGDTVWVVPQTELSGVVWLGWNTQDPRVVAEINRGVTLRFAEVRPVDGDGRMTVFLQPGNFAPPQVLYDGTSPGEAWVDLNTHTHANWIFTKPGVYLVRVEITAEGLNKQQYTDQAWLRFAVGDATSPESAFAAELPAESSTPSTPSTEATPAAAPESESSGQWLPWAIGGGTVVAVVAVGAGVLLARRRRRVEEEVFGDE
ncbi:choice-of-anchor M domain-containing protein [Enemella sp. A6]|uniref:choice-of-anchor M domain-containing protein n=1 Tax=Enemella sp. A6 TaxID=3440152 RepID=UPI003EBCE9B2